jgi:hypothetical protein
MTGRPASGRARVPEHVVHRAFGDQTVLLNLQTGQYHGLNNTGRRMFELIEKQRSLDGIATELAAEYGVSEAEIASDLVDLCAALSERGLLELDVELGR